MSKKRVDLIIRALGELTSSDPGSDHSLTIVGTGPHEPHLKELVTDLKLNTRVTFLGFVSDEELTRAYSECDLFVSADNADYDLTVMKALAHGKIIVTSTQYSIPPFLCSAKRFFAVAEPDPASFANEIRHYAGSDVRELAALLTDLGYQICSEATREPFPNELAFLKECGNFRHYANALAVRRP